MRVRVRVCVCVRVCAVADEGVSLDIAWPDVACALLVDGPTHFFSGTTHYTPLSKLHHHIVSGAGWTVTHVQHFGWDRVKASPSRRETYLRKRVPRLQWDHRLQAGSRDGDP